MKKNTKQTVPQKRILSYTIFGVICLLGIVALIIIVNKRAESADNIPVIDTPAISYEPVVPDAPKETEKIVEPEPEPEPVMIDWMAELYAENPDIVAWVKIEDTKLDYPVMFTPDDEEKYIYKNFKGWYDLSGLPFVDKDCSMDPESDNIIIYGHNMNNGEAFNTIMNYTQQSFWEEHPTVSYTTLYEERTYEIVSAFYDRVYTKDDTCFKFYQFIDADDEEYFNEAMAYFEENSSIDTGVTPEYGDNFIMLVTCSHHLPRGVGRFVLFAREVTDDTAETEISLD